MSSYNGYKQGLKPIDYTDFEYRLKPLKTNTDIRNRNQNRKNNYRYPKPKWKSGLYPAHQYSFELRLLCIITSWYTLKNILLRNRKLKM